MWKSAQDIRMISLAIERNIRDNSGTRISTYQTAIMEQDGVPAGLHNDPSEPRLWCSCSQVGLHTLMGPEPGNQHDTGDR